MEQNKGIVFLLSNSSAIQRCVDSIAERSQHLFLITDENVAKLYGKALCILFEEKGIRCDLISIPPGEESKTREMKAKIEDQMLSRSADKECAVLALGGGVISDLAGFIAATFMRGIPYYIMPTTLMAMVDAAIGGKTGLNTSFGKNHIGTIYFLEDIFFRATLFKEPSEKRIPIRHGRGN